MTPLSTEPRALDAAHLAGAAEDGEHCPTCQTPPAAGTHALDGHGPQTHLDAHVDGQLPAGGHWITVPRSSTVARMIEMACVFADVPCPAHRGAARTAALAGPGRR